MEEELTKLGFSASQAKIYIELLKKPNLLAGEISKRTGVNRRTIYDSLDTLEKKGIVGHNIVANKKHYFAIGPESIMRNIEDMKDSALKLIPKLRELSKKEQEETNIILYRGKKGVKNILNLILKCKEYVSFGATEQFPEVMEHDYYLFQNMKEKLKIKSRVILSKKLSGQKILKTVSPTTKIRFLSEKITGPTSTFIFNNKVAIFVWELPYFGILIESKNVYNSYLEYFEELWKSSLKQS